MLYVGAQVKNSKIWWITTDNKWTKYIKKYDMKNMSFQNKSSGILCKNKTKQKDSKL
jgi:hypothetical protein